MAISGSSGSSSSIGGSFSTLGSQIHEDVIEGFDFFQDMAADKATRERQARMDEQNRELARVGIQQANRSQNLQGIDRLALQRGQAEGQTRRRSFRDSLSSGLRG